MTKEEMKTFIEAMDDFGDEGWTIDSLEDSSFANMDLDSAIKQRRKECDQGLSNILKTLW